MVMVDRLAAYNAIKQQAEKAQRALVLAAGVAELEHAAGCVTEFLHTINAGNAAVS